MRLIFGSKNEHVDYRVKKGAYAVIFNDLKNKVLAVQTANGNHFLPGGGMEDNESDIECLKREVIEETGNKIEINSFIGNAICYFYSTKNEPLLSDGYFYRAKLLERVQDPVEEDHYVKWVKLEKLEESFFHEHQIWAIKKGLNTRVTLI
ncbi:NUDIX hydrolase [Oceanobacillus picturae]|uniref:NUDIX hydrolase n=1 Tax=Oceanobacillus picturae TaxID=171693 RepID=UPI00363B40DA